MKKEIIITKYLFHSDGGLEKTAVHIANSLAKKAIVTILTSKFSSDLPLDPTITIIQAPQKARCSRKKILEFDRFCSQYGLEHPKSSILALDRTTQPTHMRLGNGIHRAFLHSPIYHPWHFLIPKHRSLLSLEKKALHSSRLQKIIVNSAFVREQIHKYYSIDPQKVVVIHNGVEWKEKEALYQISLEKKEQILGTYHLPKNTFHFLFVGNGYKRKGLIPLLQALSSIQNKNFHLSVIGKEKHLKKYCRYAQKLHLDTKVSFFGYQKDLLPFYQIADCMVIPSYYDPFANVTLEALAMGVFVITSKYNGGKEIITSKNGLVTDITNVEQFAQDLIFAIETKKNPKEIRKSIKHLDFSHQMPQLIDTVLHE